jgi:hypothetical protein
VPSTNVRERNPLRPDDRRLKANKRPKEDAGVDKKEPQLDPLPWQRGLLSIPDEYDVVLTGGRGGGKTFGLVYLILRDVMRFGPDFRGALVRKELSGLRKLESEITSMMGKIPQLRGSRYVTGAKEFRFNNGAILYLHFLKDIASWSRFQGAELTGVYVDESGQLGTPEALLRMRSSMRTTNPSITPRMVLTANPNGAGAYWHLENFINKLTPWKPGWCELFQKKTVLVHSTLFDNPHLADREGYILQLRSSCGFDEARIQSEVYGSWNSVSGAFFGGVFDENRIKVPSITNLTEIGRDFDPRNLWLALDWGTRRPGAVVLAYRTPSQVNLPQGRMAGAGSVFLLDCIHTNVCQADGTPLWNVGDASMTTSKMAGLVKDLMAKYGADLSVVPKRHRVADAAIGANHGGDTGSIGAQLKKYDCPFIAAPKGRRAPGWSVMRSYLEAAGDPSAPGLYVTPACEAFWSTIPTLQCSSTDPEDLDSSQCDHLADAVRYLLTAMQDPQYNSKVGKSDFRLW